MATPRDLDPKFKTENVTPQDIVPTEETPEETPEESSEESMIVYRQQIVKPDNTVGEKVHGPMPVSKWAAYEKENNL
jgi:hypothetical protein